jgi:hypothetical protein
MACMCQLVCTHGRLLTKCLFTHITGKQTITSMCHLVGPQVTLLTKCLFTHITGIWTIASMCQLVNLEGTLVTKCLFTHITGIRTMACMCPMVNLQGRLVTKSLFTHITGIHRVSSGFLMCLHVTPVIKFLMTQSINIWTLVITAMLMFILRNLLEKKLFFVKIANINIHKIPSVGDFVSPHAK